MDLRTHEKRIMTETRSALEIVSEYVAAMASQDTSRMRSLCSPDWVLDFVHFDASGSKPLSPEDSQNFWSAWFSAFLNDYDFEVTRTIAAEEVVVVQWVFTGTFSGPLEPPISNRRIEPTGKTIQFRGVSVYDMNDGLIQRETLYMDLATMIVELGIEP